MSDDLERPAGLDFVIYLKHHGEAPWQVVATLRTDRGTERDCTPQELKLYKALAAPAPRVAELTAALEAPRGAP